MVKRFRRSPDKVELIVLKFPSAPEIREAILASLSSRLDVVIWTTDDALWITSILGGGMPGLTCCPGRAAYHVRDLFQHNDEKSPPMDAHRRALQGETPSFDLRWRDRQYEIHVGPLRGEDRPIVGCVGVAVPAADPAREKRGTMVKHRVQPFVPPNRQYRSSPIICPDVDALVAMIQGYAHMLLLRLGPGDPLRDLIVQIARAGDMAADQLRGQRIRRS